MYPRSTNRDRQFLKGVIVFGGSLVGLVVIGLFLSGVLGGGDTVTNSIVETTETSVPPLVAEERTPMETEPVVQSSEEPKTIEPVFREVSYQEAENAYTEKRYSEALDLFTLYTDQHPGNAWGHYMFGLSAWKAGQSDDAIEGFRTAIQLDPKHMKSRLNLARVLIDECRPGEALPHVQKAVELGPERGEAHRMLGRIHHNLGETEKAIGAYREAIVLNGKDVWAMNNLGLLLIERERFEEALLPLARATQIDSGMVIVQNNLGIALERTGWYGAAADAFRAALLVDDANGKVLANLERVVDREDDPGSKVDLVELASQFAKEMTRSGPEVTESATIEKPKVSDEISEVTEIPEDKP
jgi:Flp pilus assembly protein TadD